MVRRWTINGRFLQQPVTGVQRYGNEILRALDRALKEGRQFSENLDVELLIPSDAPLPADLERISVKRFGRMGGHAWEQIELPRAAGGRGLVSLCNAGPIAYRKQIACIHDLNTRIMPASYSLPFRMLYRVTVPALGRMAERIATVSHFSAQQLVSYGVCRSEKISVIPNGSEHALAWRPEHSQKSRAVADKSTILMLGSQAPHKNVAMLLGLAEELSKRGLRLALAGKSDPRIFAADSGNGPSGNLQKGGVVWLGHISDEEFAALLDDCLCFAFPSLTEGFGLPPLEAMARGCPVVVSDRASLPEVCGTAALYASPKSPTEWLAQFERLSASAELRTELSEAGRSRAQNFTWRRSADLYLQAMARSDGIAPSQLLS
jgi:glycosyltransferase involved in cell wall biosynthesis